MAGFSLITTMVLNAAGFTSGVDKASKDAKKMQGAITQSNNAIKNSFGTLINNVLPNFSNELGGLGSVMGLLKGVFGSLGTAAKTLKTAIISTGIGAILIVITTAIAGLISWMKRTDEGSDGMRKAFDIVKAVIQVLLTKLTALGSSIVKLFKGDFKGAAEDAKTAQTGWGEAIKDNIEIAKQLNETQDKLEDYNETYALKRARIEERISELQAKSREEEKYSATERLQYTKQLEETNKQLYNLNAGQKQLELQALKEEISLGNDNQDNRQKINEKEAELINMRTEYNRSLKETIKLNNKLIDDAEKEVEIEKERQNLVNNPLTLMKGKEGRVEDNNDDFKIEEQDLSDTITQWDELKKKITESKEATEIFKSTFSSLGDTMSAMFAGQKGAFKSFIGEVLAGIRKVLLAKLAEAIMSIFAGESKKGVVGLALAAGGAVVLSGLYQKWAGSFADGGIVPRSGMALVGERGPELVQLGAGSRVYTNQQTQNMLNKAGGQVVFEIKGDKLIGVLNNYNKKLSSTT